MSESECLAFEKEKVPDSRSGRIEKFCLSCPKLFLDLFSLDSRINLLKQILAVFGISVDSASWERFAFFAKAVSKLKNAVEFDEAVESLLRILVAEEGFSFDRAFFLKLSGKKLEPFWGLSEGRKIFKSDLVIPADKKHPVGKAFLERKSTVFFYHHGKDPLIYEVMTALGVSCFGMIPIWSEERPIGAVLVDNFKTMEPLDPRKVEVASELISTFASSLERADLYKELKEKLKELEEAKAEIEAQQRVILDMEKSLALKDVTSRIVHELRNPITIIGGLAERLLKKKEFDEEALRIIAREIKRINDILRDIDFYNSSAVPRKVPSDVKYLIKETIRRLRKRYPDLKIELTLPKGKLVLNVDPQHFAKLIENAVLNSYEAHKKAGVDDVIRLKARLDGNCFVLELQDKGGGIPEEIRDKVFEPFFTTKEGGTGMGIPVMAMVAKEHGGRLEIENIGGGVRLTVTLPVGGESHAEDSNSGR